MGSYLAKVSSIDSVDENGDPATARVLPQTADGVVTAPFAVFWPLRSGEGRVSVGDTVICLAFDDGSGLILSRPDGSWTGCVAGISVAGHTHQGTHGTTSAPL